MTAPLLQVRGLRTYFHREGEVARAVDGVDLDVLEGETVALVGESGCGKTATALSLLSLVESPPARIEAGEVIFRGRDLLRLSRRELRQVRGGEIAMVFQDPMTALNPVQKIGVQIAEGLRAHRRVSRGAARRRAVELLERVGIPAPAERAEAYPHQLSGGMKQRALIAMALGCEPALLIADEPTTALDVTVQAQIIGLLRELRRSAGTAVLVITHDMGVVAEMADRVAVMYAGRIVESGPAESVFDAPRHPYTALLFESMPRRHAPKSELRVIPGEVPDPFAFPPGCRFHPRCPLAVAACAAAPPPLERVGPGHEVACIRTDAVAVWRENGTRLA